jgi:glutamate-1-semialdehyde 2,1-aminomutase
MVKPLNIVAIVQARCNSLRFPNKILKRISGTPMIILQYRRIKRSKIINNVIIATSSHPTNKKLVELLQSEKINYFIGSHANVLKRYYETAKIFKADVVIRLTGDCPLVDPDLIDQVIKKFLEKKVDFASNVITPTYPDGLDIEIFNMKTLIKTFRYAKSKYDLEHVTSFMLHIKDIKILSIKSNLNASSLRWCVDEVEDFKIINAIFNHFKPNIYFNWKSVYKLVNKFPKKFQSNKTIERNQGASMTITQKLWKRAKQIIPGGNMLLSKRPELFLPNIWPAYYKKAKDCFIWDLDGKKYTDVSLMGVGSNSLGYANIEIDKAVTKAISNSNMSTLNCREEVDLCEKLLDMHQWADMAKLGRTGGETSAMCVRIARAASGKEKIAFCGYHGWHDWYLSANIKDKNNLKTHLMTGLEAKGVPNSLLNTAFPFTYNRFDELEEIVKKHDIGAIKMEVSRNFKPEDDFLKKIRKLCDRKNIILIFDECSSGFRQNFGGLHLHKDFGVIPDMAWFGKAMGNGYGITAIIGKKKVMDYVQDIFMSSTFWTERSGPVAALKTLEIMERTKSWEVITKKGIQIQNNWKKIAQSNNLKINISGLPALSTFNLTSKDWLKYKTYITQEMIKKNFLASNAFFVSTKHTDKILITYFDLLNDIFHNIEKFEKNNSSVDEKLETTVCQSGFQRLN